MPKSALEKENNWIPPSNKGVFISRSSSPTLQWSVFYNNKNYSGGTKGDLVGCNPCILGSSYAISEDVMHQGGQPNANILGNCVGYAVGRFAESWCSAAGINVKGPNDLPGALIEYMNTFNTDARYWWDKAGNNNFPRGYTPKLGAVMCWSNGGYMHVCIVEKVINETTVEISEGHWNLFYNPDKPFEYKTLYKAEGSWGHSGFQGFIYNPQTSNLSDVRAERQRFLEELEAVHGGDYLINQGSSSETYDTPKNYQYYFDYEDVTTTKTFQGLETAQGDIRRVQGAKLLSYPSLVEAPFVILKVGEYTFGTYTKNGNLNKIANVTYPNFIESMTVTKVNGTVNQYTVNLVYQIEAGNDPNLVDKILSKVGYGLIYISYGDWACPTFIYQEEEALITNVKSKVNFSTSQISYTITCTSNSITLAANTHNFPACTEKPSKIIFDMLRDNQYGLLDLFTGMRNETLVRNKGLIATNDKAVDIPSKEGMDVLSYINYLVSCMTPISNDFHSILRTSTYYLTVKDDTRGELGGPYFTVTEVQSQTNTLSTVDTYEVDVGFPNDNFIMRFDIENDNSWALLYNYADKVSTQKYVYSIDDKGHILTRYSPNITTSTTGFITTEAQKNWWTQMTQFPIKATMEIKGLLRPSMLMTYVRVNAFFYGQRHISSGLYIITKQVDNISKSGYKTTLSLVRIGGDYDVITNVTQEVTTRKPILKIGNETGWEYPTSTTQTSSEQSAATNYYTTNTVMEK